MSPPTQSQSQSHGRPQASSSRSRDKAAADLAVKVKYQNTLPDIPFDAKFVACPFVNVDRFVEYKPTSLERNHKWDILTQPDLGVKVDLIDIEKYQIDMKSRLEKAEDPTDKLLMDEEQPTPTETKRQQQHRMVLPWMRKTDYISAENRALGTAPSAADRQETRIGFGLRRRMLKESSQAEGQPSAGGAAAAAHDDAMLRDVHTQIRAIEQTFDDARADIAAHPSKKGVTAVEVLPLLPDFELWKHGFAQVVFDSDPRPAALPNAALAEEQMSSAMIRGMMDESGEQFVAYFLAGEAALDRLRALGDEEPLAADVAEGGEDARPAYEYHLAREYNWNVHNRGQEGFGQENYCLAMRSGRVLYNALDTRVRLTRRRAKDSAGAQRSRRTKLLVRHRADKPEELDAQMKRLDALIKAPGDDEDDDEEEAQGQAKEAGGSGDVAAADEGKPAVSPAPPADDDTAEGKAADADSDDSEASGDKRKAPAAAAATSSSDGSESD